MSRKRHLHEAKDCAFQTVDSQVLRDALVILASNEASQKKRNSAARNLLKQLEILAPVCLSHKFHSTARYTNLREMLHDAIQHAALVASTGDARFRGARPAEAMAWCYRVLTNHLLTELRKRERSGSETSPEQPACGSQDAETGTKEAHFHLSKLHETVLEHLRRTRNPRAVHSLYRAACCYIEHVSGVPLESQLEHWGGEKEADTTNAFHRARNRLYQYHHRGRIVLAELLEVE